jgi:6-pyruvoyltetrahydropterin/6-carboxytetrahydropterin synthase
MIRVTRRYRFPAAHVLSHASFTPEENRRIYGKCANPAGHGHDYGIEVTVTGPIDPANGRVIDPETLDAIFARRVGERFGWRLLNEDPAFEKRVPTGENLAQVIHAELAPAIASAGSARLARVRVVETRRNSFCYGDTA